jgi:hypothetical protein
VTDIREELMPRSTSLLRFSAVVTLVTLLSGASAVAQDAEGVAKNANAKLKEIREKIASGKTAADAPLPDLQRLRIEKFDPADKDIKVFGTFLDTGVAPAAGVDSPTFVSVRDEVVKIIGKQVEVGDVKFDWTEVQRIGAPKSGKGQDQDPLKPPLPHIAVQRAANDAGKEAVEKNGDRNPPADRVVVTGTRFAADGSLVLIGLRDQSDPAIGKWLDKLATDTLAKHPVLTFAGKEVGVSTSGVTGVKWSVSAPELQRVLATATPTDDLTAEEAKALRRLFVSRTYCEPPEAPDATLGWNRTVFRVKGFRMGTTDLFKVADPKLIEPKVRAQVTPVWQKLSEKTPAEGFQVDISQLLPGLDEPVAELQRAVGTDRDLDGVRIDHGFTFDENGKLLFAGLQPELTRAELAKLEKVGSAAITAYSTDKRHKEETATAYKILAARPVSADGMVGLPIKKVRADLRGWAQRTRDDVWVRRIYFPADPKALEPQHYKVAEGGLTLVCQASTKEDLEAVKAEFVKLVAERFSRGELASKMSAAKEPKEEPPTSVEPLLSGLTAELRRIMAADRNKPDAENPWYGVLIERGYFDDNDRYSIAGVVDNAGQNAKLLELLNQMKGDDKWKRYFRDRDGKDDVKPPALEAIPMKEMIARLRRVMPAYQDFDGVRVESAYYDANLNLTFRTHAVGKVLPETVGKLADLLVSDPKYTRRVVKPEQPADPRRPRLPPKVRILRLDGPAYADDQVASFSVGYGAKLLAKAGESKEARAKAKEWLDVALMHFPNEAAVWFLSAYYNFTNPDESADERQTLAKRDLYRMIDLEGPLAFNGPAQRKRRYEAAKDLQGALRNDLEALWLKSFREVKDGARPITLAGN